MSFRPNSHFTLEEAEELSQLLIKLDQESRAMTKSEYKVVKSIEWSNQSKFWKYHLTFKGFIDLTKANSQGSKGKYEIYLRLWQLYNSPLMEALK